MDARLVQSSVQTAYGELRYARARTYLPMLMERRTKDLLPPFSGLDRRESQWNRGSLGGEGPAGANCER
ncbi:three-helix bundle dimerization domain-containing protein [Streptomyces sp. NPDC059752]|uniref:three-helix bundle dimerization domain-containing protein n=1 Tax=unclassified Streptomyces TaxID=2593676 RepID=UPI00364D4DA5